MIIKMSLLISLVNNEGFKKLLNADIPPKTFFKMKNLIETLNSKLKIFEETREKLFEKYGKENEDKQGKSITPENMEFFGKELEEVINLDIEINFKPLKINDFPENVKVTFNEWESLKPFIV